MAKIKMGAPSELKHWQSNKDRKKLLSEAPKLSKAERAKLPPGGRKLGSSSRSTWKQTPASRAADVRKDKKWRKEYSEAYVPTKIGMSIDESEKNERKREKIRKKRKRPAPIGAVATTERRTQYGKVNAKGKRTVSKEAKFSGSKGMMPDDMHKKLYGHWLKTQKK